ncbi:hypothetical protein ACOI22_12135 [Glaciecola sp. 2405UD65-10]|uniref:hypothetical protein n=1 Tax=Glaciecola sp. 2405UD65-10 TaxID=3397244 RepID=UPI003B594383
MVEVIKKQAFSKLSLIAMSVAVLAGCGGSGSDDDDVGYVKFYNASYDSPSIYMTLDEDLDNDDDDEFEQTFSAIAYANASSRISVESQDYFIELAWQDEESSVRSDLEIVYEDQFKVESDVTHWVVMSDSVQSPTVTIFDIPNFDEDQQDEDSEDDIFNLRLVNLHPTINDIDVYMSESDETFNEATLLDSLQTNSLSDNFRIDEDQYKIYITLSGSSEVLFTSDEINYAFGGQYLLAVRENQGVGGSPFVVDNISNSSITQYDALESTANVSIFNGLNSNDLVADYDAKIDITINGVTAIPDIDALEYGAFSEAYVVDSGDYRFSVANDTNDEIFLENRILSLPQNTNRTLFLYWTEEEVDDDNDGIVDEDEDGIVDEIRPVITSLVVDNSDRSRLYDKELLLLNLVNSDDFSVVSFYFVKSDEIIETAENSRNVIQGNASSLILLNNTYQVFVVASIDNNEIILDELSLTLDEDSTDQFLILEHSDVNSSGYALRSVDQISGTDDE